jgi:4-amino-4-deoxy-L-arabinose transferase-like glycosyltransferase
MLLAAAVALVAAGLRLPGLATRPMHADEAVLADKFGTLVESGRWSYDPKGFHGPALPYLTLPVAWARGQFRDLDLDEITLRLAPALAGIALALAPLLVGAPAAAFLVAASPVMVYYSRDYIPEVLLALFTAAAIGCGYRYAVSRRLFWAVLCGLSLGLMWATKETAAIAYVAMAAGLVAARARIDRRTALAVAAPALLFLPAESVGSLYTTYFSRAFSDPLHAHPWYYYFTLFGWAEIMVLVLAVVAVVRVRAPLVRFLAVYALVMIAIYSALPYKTPWCVLSAWYAAALLAGLVSPTRLRAAAVALLVPVLAFQSWHGARDPRSRYAYVETTPDVFLIRSRLQELTRVKPELAVLVLTSDNPWPLPWYLRGIRNTGWARAVPESGRPPDTILVLTTLEPALARWLYEIQPPGERELYMSMSEGPLQLRRGVELRGYARKSLWDRLERPESKKY